MLPLRVLCSEKARARAELGKGEAVSSGLRHSQEPPLPVENWVDMARMSLPTRGLPKFLSVRSMRPLLRLLYACASLDNLRGCLLLSVPPCARDLARRWIATLLARSFGLLLLPMRYSLHRWPSST